MNPAARPGLSALLALALAAFGCSETTSTSPTNISETPTNVLEPRAPDESRAEAQAKTENATATEAAVKPESPAATPGQEAPKPEAAAAEPGGVVLTPVKYDEMMKRIADKKAKLTLVDAWATWCGPCKENFPHVVEMNAKYGGQGLAVVSLSLDDPSDSKAVTEARKFLQEKKAAFTNFLLDEEAAVAFERLNISGIPAVFLYDPSGKELRRFTMDDPNNQFTYDQVEQTVAALLKGEPVPEGDKGGEKTEK